MVPVNNQFLDDDDNLLTIDDTVVVTITGQDGTLVSGQGDVEEVVFENTQYANLSLTSAQLEALGGGQFTATAEYSGYAFSKTVYFHTVAPVVSFGSSSSPDLLDGVTKSVADSISSSNITISGTLEITLPAGVELPDTVVEDTADTVDELVDDRTLYLQFRHATTDALVGTVEVTLDKADKTGDAYNWSYSFSSIPDWLTDAPYKVKAVFTDLYGSQTEATYSDAFTVDTQDPSIASELSSDFSTTVKANAVDETIEMQVTLSEAVTVVEDSDGEPENITLSVVTTSPSDDGADEVFRLCHYSCWGGER